MVETGNPSRRSRPLARMPGSGGRLLPLVVVVLSMWANLGCVAGYSVHGKITEDVKWFLSDLSVVHAKTATLQYNITFPASLVVSHTHPVITFYYNDQNSPNLGRECEVDMYGQLRNEDLGVPLRTGRPYRGKFKCDEDSEKKTMVCTGLTEIQDFEPKAYSFSLAYNCKDKSSAPPLTGVVYNVTISEESNTTRCVELFPRFTPEEKKHKKTIDRCERSYRYGAIPNSIGSTDVGEAMWQLRKGLGILDNMIDLFTHKTCLERVYQFLCIVFFPECLPEQNQMILPCYEDCNDALNECLKIAAFTPLVEEFVVNCEYLPRMNGSVPCYTKLDVCGPPPEVEHANITGHPKRPPYAAEGEVLEYVCPPTHALKGPNNVTCLKNGQWTKPPHCRKRYNLTLIICCCAGGLAGLILGITLLVVLGRRLVAWHRRRRGDNRGLSHVQDDDETFRPRRPAAGRIWNESPRGSQEPLNPDGTVNN